MYDRARFKEEMGLSLRTNRFAAVAQWCSQQLGQEIQKGLRPMSHEDLQHVILKYLLPFFGKYNLSSLVSRLVREFEIWRNQQIGHMPVAIDDGTQTYGFLRTFKRLLTAAGRKRDASTGQFGTLYSLRRTCATMELFSGTGSHTLSRQMGTSVFMLKQNSSKLTATMAAERLA